MRRQRRSTVVALRVLWVGAELAVTVGLVLLLLVAHQLWWTNRQARAGAERQVRALERAWNGAPQDEPVPPAPPAPPASPGSAAPSAGSPEPAPAPAGTAPPDAYAILRIPALGLTVPVARGVSRRGVLDRGYAGHYPGTAGPGGAGNFALAGHRNSHGEPFRRIDRLRSGDAIVVETRDAVHTYAVDRVLPRTSPRDTAVIAAVPKGYDEPGHYLTLTTCTPEYSSAYRLVVWGKLRAVRPR
ncbi:class E sortase [Streptomyces sp. NPDC093595]|uniref:class E sortase n=1 Tax=Streptomyces sp. NPDC093595 TaxID=3366045 RepID=UPI0037F1A5D8